MASAERKDLSHPDETRTFEKGGRLRVRMADGTEFEATPGEVTALPPGHDAWVVGDEPVVVVDWYGASNYARTPEAAATA